MQHDSNPAALFCESDLAVSKYIIYTPSRFARSSLLHLQEVGSLQAVKPYTTGRSGLSSYLFFIVRSGSGSFIYEGTEYRLNTGDCVFIDCRKTYSQITSEDLWELQWAHFNGPTMEEIYGKFRERGGLPVFHPKYGPQYQELLNQMYHLAGSGSYIVNMELSQMLMNLLTVLMKETWDRAERRKTTGSKVDIDAVRQYIDSNYMETITLDSLAEVFFIDKFYLTKIFKAQFDTTINNYLNQVRITKAKELLRFSELPIEEIGEKVGIGEPNYFARVFKKIEGVSPSSYRSQW